MSNTLDILYKKTKNLLANCHICTSHKNCQQYHFICDNCVNQLQLSTSFITSPQNYGSSFDQLYLACAYRKHAKHLINSCKTNNQWQLGMLIAELIAHNLQPLLASPAATNYTLISTVPLHWHKLACRGYNQSEIISNHLAKILDLPSTALVTKTMATKPQRGLSSKKRRRNLVGAFTLQPISSPNLPDRQQRWPQATTQYQCKKMPNNCLTSHITPNHNPAQITINHAKADSIKTPANLINCQDEVWVNGYNIKDRNIILVDDVITTGTTLNTLSKILKEKGKVRKILAVCFAGTII